MFEDDVLIPIDFLSSLELVLSELPDTWDILYLSYMRAWEFERPQKFSDHLVSPSWPLGFYAYAVSPRGAARLLQEFNKNGFTLPEDCVDCGIDAVVARWIYEKSIFALAASPEICYHSFSFKSVIGNRDHRVPRDLLQLMGSATFTPTPTPTVFPSATFTPTPTPTPSPTFITQTFPPFGGSPTEVSGTHQLIPKLLTSVIVLVGTVFALLL